MEVFLRTWCKHKNRPSRSRSNKNNKPIKTRAKTTSQLKFETYSCNSRRTREKIVLGQYFLACGSGFNALNVGCTFFSRAVIGSLSVCLHIIYQNQIIIVIRKYLQTSLFAIWPNHQNVGWLDTCSDERVQVFVAYVTHLWRKESRTFI